MDCLRACIAVPVVVPHGGDTPLVANWNADANKAQQRWDDAYLGCMVSDYRIHCRIMIGDNEGRAAHAFGLMS